MVRPMRLDQLTKAELSAEQDALYDALIGGLLGGTRSAAVITDDQGYVQGPFTVMLHHPTVGHPVQDLGAVLRFRGSLSDRARELVILVVAAHWRSDFEWWAHERIGRNVGLTDSEIDALRTGAPLTVADAVDQAALDAAPRWCCARISTTRSTRLRRRRSATSNSSKSLRSSATTRCSRSRCACSGSPRRKP